MNWYATWGSDENGIPVLTTLITKHDWLSEACEMVGLCAIPIARESLIIGIGKWLDSRSGVDTRFADLGIFPEDARIILVGLDSFEGLSIKVCWDGWYWKGHGQDFKSAVMSARRAEDGIDILWTPAKKDMCYSR